MKKGLPDWKNIFRCFLSRIRCTTGKICCSVISRNTFELIIKKRKMNVIFLLKSSQNLTYVKKLHVARDWHVSVHSDIFENASQTRKSPFLRSCCCFSSSYHYHCYFFFVVVQKTYRAARQACVQFRTFPSRMKRYYDNLKFALYILDFDNNDTASSLFFVYCANI